MAANEYFEKTRFLSKNHVWYVISDYFWGVEPTSGPQVIIIGHMKVKTWSQSVIVKYICY